MLIWYHLKTGSPDQWTCKQIRKAFIYLLIKKNQKTVPEDYHLFKNDVKKYNYNPECDKWMNAWKNVEWMDGRMNEWMDEWMNKCTM